MLQAASAKEREERRGSVMRKAPARLAALRDARTIKRALTARYQRADFPSIATRYKAHLRWIHCSSGYCYLRPCITRSKSFGRGSAAIADVRVQCPVTIGLIPLMAMGVSRGSTATETRMTGAAHLMMQATPRMGISDLMKRAPTPE